jgi:AcrR family transcriptional regulator
MGIVERKEREKEARRAAILDAAESVFMESGFGASTMEDIAKRAELAKGTVYLYYRSKEELQLGLVQRGLEMLYCAFEKGMENRTSAIERLLTLGDAYWGFADSYYFYFELLHVAELPYRPGQVSESSLSGLHERSNAIWSLIIGEIERAKTEGTINPDVSSMTVASLLWLNATGVLRQHFRMKAMSESMLVAERSAGGKLDLGDTALPSMKHFGSFSMCQMDWRAIYRLNATLLFHEIVTGRGAMYLQPLEWPSENRACSEDRPMASNLVSSAFTHSAFSTTPSRFSGQKSHAVSELPFEHYHETGV